jgi:hypothetical protein
VSVLASRAMHAAHKVVTLTLMVAAISAGSLSGTAGCGDTGSTGGGGNKSCLTPANCYDYTCYTQGKARSFKTDVLPIFEQSCSLSSSCHGDPKSPTSTAGYQPYLGEVDPEITPSDTTKILGLIVNQMSPTAPDEKIVDPGKPESSFLMQKMDGTLKCTSIKCTFNACGTSMPQGVDPLPIATRDVIRDWIKQGALDN